MFTFAGLNIACLMKKPRFDHRHWWWVATAVVALVLLLSAVQACRGTSSAPAADDAHRALVDSLLRDMQDLDSLQAMTQRYHDDQDVTGEILSHKYLGQQQRKQSRYLEAIGTHVKGLKLATEACDTLEMMSALNELGANYRRMGDLSVASGHLFQSLKLSDDYSDPDSDEALKRRIMALNGLGNIEIEMWHFDTAVSMLRQALDGEQRLGSPLGMAINYANLGIIKQTLGETDSAWFYYRKSQEMNRQAGSVEGEALCHIHYGELYEGERKYSHAKEEYHCAYEILKNTGERYHWLEAIMPLTRMSILLGELSQARRYLQEAEQEAQRINSKEHLYDACKIHYDLALLDGDIQQALDYHIRSEAMSDSIYGLDKSEEMRRQRLDYENSLKDGEMSLLNDDISHLKRSRNTILLSLLFLILTAGAVIIALYYANRVRTRTQRMLRQVEETRSLFFTNVVHQLRTPLTVIMGATDSIISEGVQSDLDTRSDHLNVIERQGRNLLRLVDRILEVGSVRSALREPEWRSGDAATLVRMVVESYRDQCVERHMELIYTHIGDDATIETVPRYLQTILSSFLENAINYGHDFGKITVTSSVDKRHLTVRVTDDGMGIDESDLPHVFEPFYRGAQAEHLLDGVGIGLTVARDMAMAMGGSVKADSTSGEGAQFTVTLPCTHSDIKKLPFDLVIQSASALTKRRDKIADIETETTLAATDGDRPVVMVVEDHADVARLVGKVIGRCCDVQYAANGEQALFKMQQHRPDLMITDVKMPKMDGHELCRRVRASEQLRTIPIIMLSARTADGDRIRGIEAGADAYLLKPFVAEELLAWVHRLLESRRLLRNDIARSIQHQLPPASSPSTGDAPCTESPEGDAMFLDKFKLEVEKQMGVGSKLDFDQIALSLKMGESKLRQCVQQLTGKNMSTYIVQLRMERAMHLLHARPDLRVGDVAELCGYADVAYFSRTFRQHYGMTPTEARNSK